MGAMRAPWWFALLCALLGGTLLNVATPAVSWWPAGILGAVFALVSLWQQHWAWGALWGAVVGIAFWGPHISWLTLYLGPVPWIALCSVMVFWWVICGALIAFATGQIARLTDRVPWWGVASVQTLSVAGLWVLREQVQSNWPYGGFAWGRLAHSLAEAPGVGLVSWVGFAGASGILVAFAAGVVACAWVAFSAQQLPHSLGAGPHRYRRSAIAAAGGVCVVAVVTLTITPVASIADVGELRVAAVQGNSESAIFDDRESGSVLRDHIEGTERLVDELEQRDQRVDVIVWPENSAEFDITNQFFSVQRITALADRAGAPIVVGTILPNPDGSFSNSTMVFDGAGVVDVRYDKRRPVPFAEYMPNRDFFHALVPELVDLVQLEYAPGERDSVLPLDTVAGVVRAGIAICFDIIFDDHAVALAHSGAQVVFAQTNNADFGDTDQSAQQLQIAQLRAVEMGRAVVNISTVGTSAVVLPDGSKITEIEPFTADSMIATVPLRDGDTPAMRVGALWSAMWITWGVLGCGLALTIVLVRRDRPSFLSLTRR